jgi:nitrogen fixation NifU-like protein
VKVYLRVEDDVVEEVGFEGSGCAISTASASLMTESVKGKKRSEVQEIFERFHALVAGEDAKPPGGSGLGKLEALAGVREFPMRVKCATLVWHALVAALHQSQGTVTTETGTEERTPEQIRTDVIDALRSIYDPEIPVDIYELGLVYDVSIDDSGAVQIRMTLTSPMCPVAGSLPPEVEAKVSAVPGVSSAGVDLVWDPPWNPSMMSEAARIELGM